MDTSSNITRHYNWMLKHSRLQGEPRWTRVYNSFVRLLEKAGILADPNFSMCSPTDHLPYMESRDIQAFHDKRQYDWREELEDALQDWD